MPTARRPRQDNILMVERRGQRLKSVNIYDGEGGHVHQLVLILFRQDGYESRLGNAMKHALFLK